MDQALLLCYPCDKPSFRLTLTCNNAAPSKNKHECTVTYMLQDQDEELEFEKFLEEIQGTKVRTEVIIRLLGIQNCVDTVVGNAYIRGVSGGERKRVTSAEMLVGPKVRAFVIVRWFQSHVVSGCCICPQGITQPPVAAI